MSIESAVEPSHLPEEWAESSAKEGQIFATQVPIPGASCGRALPAADVHRLQVRGHLDHLHAQMGRMGKVKTGKTKIKDVRDEHVQYLQFMNFNSLN